MDQSTGGQGLRLFIKIGFRLALLYGALGLGIEILHRFLPAGVYQRSAGALSALPSWILATLGLDGHLTAALVQGEVPGWLVGAAIPLVGVAIILSLSLVLGLMWSFGGAVVSLKNR